MDPDKIKAIMEMKPPRTEKDPRVFWEDTIHKQVHRPTHHDM